MDKIWGMVTSCVLCLTGLFLILEVVQGHSIAAILARMSIVILAAGGAMFFILVLLQPLLVTRPKPAAVSAPGSLLPPKAPGGERR